MYLENSSITKKDNKLHDPRVTIIVPVYNCENYIQRCLESLVKQSYEYLNIIIVNDGSTDNSPEICEEYANRFEFVEIINKNNGGLGSARNVGIEASKGDFIMFVDSDDWIMNDTVEYMVGLAVRYNADIVDVGVIQTREFTYKCDSRIESIKTYTGKEALEHYLSRGLKEQNGAPFSACRKLYNRIFFDKGIRFDERTVSEDICFNFLVIQECNCEVVSNQIKYFYFKDIDSLTTRSVKGKDLGLIDVTEQLVELANRTDEPQLVRLAKLKRARTDFSLLARMALYGADDIADCNKVEKQLITGLRQNLWKLISSQIAMSRKVLMVAFCVNYAFCRKILRLRKR